MFAILISLLVGFIVVGSAEVLFQKKRISVEASRKIVHITSGLIAAILPFFVSWRAVLILEIVNLVAMFGLRYFGWQLTQHHVKRLTWGEMFFALGIMAPILLGVPRWVYVVAVLHLTFADTAAALIGQKWGKKHTYKILGQQKSIVGSAAFIVVSTLIVMGVFVLTPDYLTMSNFARFLLVPFAAMAAEYAGVFGSDNLLIPLTVALLLG